MNLVACFGLNGKGPWTRVTSILWSERVSETAFHVPGALFMAMWSSVEEEVVPDLVKASGSSAIHL